MVYKGVDQISIHALREEGDFTLPDFVETERISIHALREEGDENGELKADTHKEISIHALREEGDGASGQTLPPR